MKTIITSDTILIILAESEAILYNESPLYAARVSGHALETGVTHPTKPISVLNELREVLHSFDPIEESKEF